MNSGTEPRNNIEHLKAVILGETDSLGSPTVYLPSQTFDRWPKATAAHEWVHKVLIMSTIYGLAERMIAFLIRNQCRHIGVARLTEALSECLQSSFNCHEGSAVFSAYIWMVGNRPSEISKFKNELRKDYRDAFERVTTSVVPLQFAHEGVQAWFAIELASFCLCPLLMDKLRDFSFWSSDGLLKIWKAPEINADSRLRRLTNDLALNEKLVRLLKEDVSDCLKESFGSGKLDWSDQEKRKRFISKCEPILELHLNQMYPQSSVSWGNFLNETRGLLYNQMKSSFSSHGCHCLDRFLVLSPPISLIEPPDNITPIISAEWRGHEGAID